MGLEHLRIVVLSPDEDHPQEAAPGAECSECQERPATQGTVCDACHTEAIMLRTLALFQRRVDLLDQARREPYREFEPTDPEDDDDEPLCVDCRLMSAEEERRCRSCFRRFVVAEAIEIVRQEYDEMF